MQLTFLPFATWKKPENKNVGDLSPAGDFIDFRANTEENFYGTS